MVKAGPDIGCLFIVTCDMSLHSAGKIIFLVKKDTAINRSKVYLLK